MASLEDIISPQRVQDISDAIDKLAAIVAVTNDPDVSQGIAEQLHEISAMLNALNNTVLKRNAADYDRIIREFNEAAGELKAMPVRADRGAAALDAVAKLLAALRDLLKAGTA